jgi:iron complex outermembrane recepter protein
MKFHGVISGFAAAMLASTSSAALAQQAGPQAGAEESEPAALQDIIVTARRTSERLQDVPIAVSVLTSATLEAKGTFNPVDLVQSAPGLAVTATISDRNNLTYTIRGQGFAFGAVFPSVITYFNDVPVAQLTQGAFYDMSNVQVLKGPQGVNFGRVTNGGNVLLSPMLPQNDFGGYAGVKVGNFGLRTVNGAVNIPLVDDKVLFRGAFETARRDGFTTNLFNGQTLDNVSYQSYRGALTVRPVEGLENTTVVSYQKTDDNGTAVIFEGINAAALGATYGGVGFLFGAGYGFDSTGDIRAAGPGLTPFSAANFLNPAIPGSITAQLAAQQARGPREVNLSLPNFSRRKSIYVVNTTTADLTDDIQLKNVFGFVSEEEDAASTFSPINGSVNTQCRSACGGKLFNDRKQFSEELRLSGRSLEGKLNWVLGLYADEQSPDGEYENTVAAVGIIRRTLVNYITTRSRAVYGSVDFELTDKLSINGGLRYTHDTIRSDQTDYQTLFAVPGAQQALVATLTGPLGAFVNPARVPFDAQTANFLAASTYTPIPYGTCQTFGAGSLLYPNGPVGCQTIEASYNATTWTFGANYKTGSGQMFYAKVSKGYRPGGVNSTAGGLDPRYNPETNISVEIGAKAVFDLNGVPVRGNVAAYRDRYQAIQKNIVAQINNTNIGFIRNVSDAVVKGVEFDGSIGPVSGFTLGGTAAYTDAKFDENSTNPFASRTDGCDPNALSTNGKFCVFNRFNATPEFQWTVKLNYDLPLPEDVGRVSIGGLVYHQSSIATNDTSRLNPRSIIDPYTTLDLNVNWTNVLGAPVDLGFFMTNVTNKLFRIGTNDLSQRSSLGTFGSIYGPPRMWGFSMKYRFGSDAQ